MDMFYVKRANSDASVHGRIQIEVLSAEDECRRDDAQVGLRDDVARGHQHGTDNKVLFS